MINYQIISKKNDEGWYMPDYEKLINNAKTVEEKEYINKIKDRNITFAYNMVYITKLKCGHYEIFQTPCNKYHLLNDNLNKATDIVSNQICSDCIINAR